MKNIKNIIEQKYPPENPNDLWMKNDVLYKSTNKGWMPLTAGGGSSNIIPITWQKLKDLRNSSKLIPGSLYRITDYNCTTTQENTRSAGHQFDIVLLALSENKLAEEGWAMEHPTDVYDVTFSDGVKKCYIYIESNGENCNIVDVETLMGCEDILDDFDEIDYVNKTAVYGNSSDALSQPNLIYNYFQNSNLSAWKVWYCLDNDKSRFAWADDNVIGDIENIVVYYPEFTIFGVTTPAHDAVYTLTNETQIVRGVTYFKLLKLEGVHTSDMDELFVDTKNINTETTLYIINSGFGTTTVQASPMGISIKSINYNTPPTEEGRGVIYRLIDEFNNDCPYDFKNILIYNETYSQYCYAIIDNTENNFDVDPTLDGTKVKAIHVLCDNNDELKPIAKGGFGNNPLVNVIFLNNNTLADEYSNCIISNGLPIVS